MSCITGAKVDAARIARCTRATLLRPSHTLPGNTYGTSDAVQLTRHNHLRRHSPSVSPTHWRNRHRLSMHSEGVAHLNVVAVSVLFAPRHQLGLDGHHDAHQRRLLAVAVHPNLVHHARLLELVLELLHSHVLTVSKLEQVLLAVDDAQRARGQQLADVARVEPAVRVYMRTTTRCCASSAMDARPCQTAL